MWHSDRAAGADGVATTRRLVTGLTLAAFAVAVGGALAAGMPSVGVAALVAASVAAEYAANSVTTTGDAAPGADPEPPESVRSAVVALSEDLGVAAPDVVYNPDGPPGVCVLREGDRRVLFVSGPLADRLDETAVRGLLAHELAHVALGHLRRVPLRDAVAHVVGGVVLWTVFLQGQSDAVAVVVVGGFLAAGLPPQSGVNALVYVLGSLGVVLAPMALAAYASRLEECRADDVAVDRTDPLAFCTGLYHVTTAPETSTGGVGRPAGERGEWGFLSRAMASHPTVERRLARQGLDVADVADPGSAGVGGAATD